MLKLQLLRHAKSTWDDPSLADFDRPLAARGVRDAELLADHLRHSGNRPRIVVCSPALRARQTLDHIASGLDLGLPVLIEDRIYGATAQALWRRIRDLPDDVAEVMLIGHNPGLHELATSLAAEGDDESLVRLRHKLPTCALVTLVWSADSWASLRRTDAVLHDYVRPRDL